MSLPAVDYRLPMQNLFTGFIKISGIPTTYQVVLDAGGASINESSLCSILFHVP